jgi:hypothetical protein
VKSKYNSDDLEEKKLFKKVYLGFKRLDEFVDKKSIDYF